MPSSITLTVSHLPTSTSFFLSALQPLNYIFRARQDQTIGFGPSSPGAVADFWITQEIPGVPAGAAHVAFPASSRGQVHDFFVAALKAGGKIHGEPCQRDASGYYSAAVIDFDGNSIEAVYRPGQQVEGGSGVSHQSKAPLSSVVITPSKTRSVVPGTKGAPTVMSNASKSNVTSKAPSHVTARSVTAPTPALSHVSRSVAAKSVAPNASAQVSGPTKKEGDVLTNLMAEARNAVNVARDLVNSVGGGSGVQPPSNIGVAVNTGTASGTSTGTSDAIVGTILGVAAGAALHYAFSNRSKESQTSSAKEEHRPSIVGRSISGPAAPEYSYSYSTTGSGVKTYYEGPDGRVYRAIEPAPAISSYTYAPSEEPRSRLIELKDNDPPAQLALPAPRSSAGSGSTITIRPANGRRSSVIDSGFGTGPISKVRDDASQSHASSSASRLSLSSRHSKKSKSGNEAPPTSYRAPTVLTTAETQTSGKSRHSSKARSQSQSRTRSSSVSRNMSRLDGGSEVDGGDPTRSRSRSHSRAPSGSHTSRKSRRDEFDDEAKTVYHVSERKQSQIRRNTSVEHVKTVGARQPHEYPLPPSRAATWAGSDGGSGSFVSAISRPGRTKQVVVPAGRTIIGKLTPVHLRGAGEVDGRDCAERDSDSVSVVSKQKDLARLDVTDREVGPEDSGK
ncbi:hypothetical protein LTR13_004581 [Exophiala sideris]|uniref:VOC domain-containing protein n=1 Tax=Exophiala sideris TaxID=1016849 RepID=A0ABR0J8Q1_9EURO|nr:hypothetical protein LTR13_004581 [Exophiala sideris]KAK5059086.1 hypothetical protein LTR69_006375 [Exophiala sideris]KAK5182919.1 hypothetical protein LTR44_004629 [Eurotiomycetes sp. CCFEE 6388]